MKYIAIEPKRLTLKASSAPIAGRISIRITSTRSYMLRNAFCRLIYHEVLYPVVIGQRRRIAACLQTPDAWLFTIAAIMWEGCIQGMTWDAIKRSVSSGLAYLRLHDLAPPALKSATTVSGRKRKVGLRLEFGVAYSDFARDGTKQRELFIGIRNVFEQVTSAKQRAIGRSRKRKSS